MRLWSIHPKYLDTTGLTACWREALLARKVLSGETKGYKNHPQLYRFKQCSFPLNAIEAYLYTIFEESSKRGLNYDSSKINMITSGANLFVTDGQLQYEFEHLKHKLSQRNIGQYDKLSNITVIEPNPLFKVVNGDVENWEVAK